MSTFKRLGVLTLVIAGLMAFGINAPATPTAEQTLNKLLGTQGLTLDQLLAQIAAAESGSTILSDIETLQGHALNTANPHEVTAAQVGADPSGTAAAAVGTHESTYDHGSYDTVVSAVNDPTTGLAATNAAVETLRGYNARYYGLQGDGATDDQPALQALVNLVSETGGGTGATATATVTGGVITAVTVVNGGSGYTYAPKVSVTGVGGHGSGASLVAVISNGVVTSIDIRVGGTGYTSGATLAIDGGGGGTIYLPKGVYVLHAAVQWRSGISLVGDGPGKTIIKTVCPLGSAGFPAIIAYDATANSPYMDCDIKSLEIDGSGILDTAYSVYIKAVAGHFFRRCTYRDLYLHDTVASALGIDFLDQCVIDNVTCYNCGRGWKSDDPSTWTGGAGLGIGTGEMPIEHNIIVNCHIYECGRYGILLEEQTDTEGCPNAEYIISNCVVRGGRNTGIELTAVNGVAISNCIISDNASDGIQTRFDCDELQISNCLFNNNLGAGINFTTSSSGLNVTNVTIEGCHFYHNAFGIRHDINVNATVVKQLAVLGNVFDSQVGEAVYISQLGTWSRIYIRSNRIFNCAANAAAASKGNGMNIDGGSATLSEISICDNTIAGCAGNGVRMQVGGVSNPAKGIEVSRNTIYNNGASATSAYQNGIKVMGYVTGLQICNNVCYDDQVSQKQLYGIYELSDSVYDYGNIQYNDCRRCPSGGVVLGGTNTNTTAANNQP